MEHEPWPLRAAACEEVTQDLTAAACLPAPAGPPLAHFSDGVHQVRFGLPHPVRARGTR
ncbi:DUF2071 domain-containing protein [Kitasatospora phosalacinea]|uniref:DUF2071 domain-containing protein n=1 Tax=Kitasatospora phosalacinea TaxID=2065 RepID=UPI000ADE2968